MFQNYRKSIAAGLGWYFQIRRQWNPHFTKHFEVSIFFTHLGWKWFFTCMGFRRIDNVLL